MAEKAKVQAEHEEKPQKEKRKSQGKEEQEQKVETQEPKKEGKRKESQEQKKGQKKEGQRKEKQKKEQEQREEGQEQKEEVQRKQKEEGKRKEPKRQKKEGQEQQREEQQQKYHHHGGHETCDKPCYTLDWYKGSEKLKDNVAIITGGDSGIGRAVAILFAREGAHVAIMYHKNEDEANETKKLVEKETGKCLLIRGDVSQKHCCEEAVNKTLEEYQKLDILVNSASIHCKQEHLENITEEQLEHTFKTNIFSMFFMVQASLEHLKKSRHASIINTSSYTGFHGHPHLMDYASTKGAIVAYTRALSQNLAKYKIRVNAVAPGPIYTPLVLQCMDEEEKKKSTEKIPF